MAKKKTAAPAPQACPAPDAAPADAKQLQLRELLQAWAEDPERSALTGPQVQCMLSLWAPTQQELLQRAGSPPTCSAATRKALIARGYLRPMGDTVLPTGKGVKLACDAFDALGVREPSQAGPLVLCSMYEGGTYCVPFAVGVYQNTTWDLTVVIYPNGMVGAFSGQTEAIDSYDQCEVALVPGEDVTDLAKIGGRWLKCKVLQSTAGLAADASGEPSAPAATNDDCRVEYDEPGDQGDPGPQVPPKAAGPQGRSKRGRASRTVTPIPEPEIVEIVGQGASMEPAAVTPAPDAPAESAVRAACSALGGDQGLDRYYAVVLGGPAPAYLLGTNTAGLVQVLPLGSDRDQAFEVLTKLAEAAGCKPNLLPAAGRQATSRGAANAAASGRGKKGPTSTGAGAQIRVFVAAAGAPKMIGSVRLLPDDKTRPWQAELVLKAMREAAETVGPVKPWSPAETCDGGEAGLGLTMPAGESREALQDRVRAMRDAGRAAMEAQGYNVRRV